MPWLQSGGKPLSEPMIISLVTHIRDTRPQWVNNCELYSFVDLIFVPACYISIIMTYPDIWKYHHNNTYTVITVYYCITRIICMADEYIHHYLTRMKCVFVISCQLNLVAFTRSGLVINKQWHPPTLCSEDRYCSTNSNEICKVP